MQFAIVNWFLYLYLISFMPGQPSSVRFWTPVTAVVHFAVCTPFIGCHVL